MIGEDHGLVAIDYFQLYPTISRTKTMVWHLLLNSVIKIVLVPVGVADVVTSCTSPWIPIVNSCKQANEPVNFEQLEKRLIISETSLVPSSSTQSIRFPRGVGNKGV